MHFTSHCGRGTEDCVHCVHLVQAFPPQPPPPPPPSSSMITEGLVFRAKFCAWVCFLEKCRRTSKERKELISLSCPRAQTLSQTEQTAGFHCCCCCLVGGVRQLPTTVSRQLLTHLLTRLNKNLSEIESKREWFAELACSKSAPPLVDCGCDCCLGYFV